MKHKNNKVNFIVCITLCILLSIVLAFKWVFSIDNYLIDIGIIVVSVLVIVTCNMLEWEAKE